MNTPDNSNLDRMALQAAQNGTIIYDRTHWGRLRVRGDDRLRFLHNQSTNDFQSLKPGQSRETVFVTSTARTIDLASAYATEADVLLLVSPNRRQTLLDWLDRYIFPMDQVEVEDITEATACFSLIGEASQAKLGELGIVADDLVPNDADLTHQLVQFAGGEVRLAAGCGLALPGYTTIGDRDRISQLTEALTRAGAISASDTVWEQLRVQQGRPAPDAELTEDYNPLEARLWPTISFEKGCYIGQETIARLNTYKGVKTQLWGIRLMGKAQPGTPITLGDEKIGQLTSVVETGEGYIGLGYIRTKAGGAGLKVQVGETQGEAIDVPFLTRQAGCHSSTTKRHGQNGNNF
jgi:folate-binding protein YgfZ